jgi:hypothetical protein
MHVMSGGFPLEQGSPHEPGSAREREVIDNGFDNG